MAHLEHRPPTSAKERSWRSLRTARSAPLMALGGVVASLAVMASLYLGHDIVKSRVSPCESIFEQTSVGLSTKIKFLKAEGALEIGRNTLTELTERAQMVALNLKTCCTVLDAGRLNPEEFLQCKSRARQYEAKVEDVVALVGAAPPVVTGSTEGSGAAPAAAPAAAQPAIVEKAVAEARSISQEFNQRVVEVRKAQALESLEALPDAQVDISAAEKEPNDDAFSANVIPLSTWAKAAIGSEKELDFFKFTTPEPYRDWITIEVQNRSTTLHPNMQIFDANKSSIGQVHNTTAGADLKYTFVAPPGTSYSVALNSYYGNSTGVYLVRVAPQKAYDSYEPNDDILNAKRVAAGKEIVAKIMDGRDSDYFSTDGKDVRDVAIKLVNKSASLHPNATVFDATKTQIANSYNTTAGGDLSLQVKAPAGPLYVRVSDYYTEAGGDYALTIGD